MRSGRLDQLLVEMSAPSLDAFYQWRVSERGILLDFQARIGTHISMSSRCFRIPQMANAYYHDRLQGRLIFPRVVKCDPSRRRILHDALPLTQSP